LHSPFLFGLYINAIKSKREIPQIESLRKKLRTNKGIIEVTDFKSGITSNKSIREIANTSLSSKKFSYFLNKLIAYIEAKNILECGTSLGINTLYMSESKTAEKIYTIEGSQVISNLASKNFANNDKIKLIQGDVYQLFEQTVASLKPDLVFLDADHRSEAISFYLEALFRINSEVKCIVIHDIYWSKGMAIKWNEIINDPKMILTVDLFQAGLIFPNLEMQKQHFILKF